ncbi:MAG: nickel-dependent lactate racemase [Euryarchaeota archaeon]|nr:nickel-dependent lactate racemase [Euryarchaeota archaeon]
MKIQLPYGHGSVFADVPGGNLAGVLEPNELPAVEDYDLAVVEALDHPIGNGSGVKLSDIAHPGDSVAIIVNDITRITPTEKLLPSLVAHLGKIGIPDSDIKIVFATGSHRKHTKDEQKILIGNGIYDRISCIDHDPDCCRRVGVTSGGTPIEVFTPVLDANVVICTGSIEFHYYAGYSGGLKSLLPGVSSLASIRKNHALMIHPDAVSGRIDSPVRQDIEEGTRGISKFILNAVLNSKKEIIAVVSGDPVEAHRAGALYVDQMYRIPAELADIVIASPGGMPKDINLYQSQKALENAKNIVKDGGTIILVAECPEGLGNAVYERWLSIPRGELLPRLEGGFELGGHKAVLTSLLAERADLHLVSTIPDDLAKKAYFTPEDTVQSALDAAISKHGANAQVLVMPHGGLTCPTTSPSPTTSSPLNSPGLGGRSLTAERP